MLSKKLFLLSLCLLFISSLYAEEKYPFPQHKRYDHCTYPDYPTDDLDQDVSDFYFYWKNKYLKNAVSTPGGYYVNTPGSTTSGLTVSEAHGYGMIISALLSGPGQLADSEGKKVFDGMYKLLHHHV